MLYKYYYYYYCIIEMISQLYQSVTRLLENFLTTSTQVSTGSYYSVDIKLVLVVTVVWTLS